MAATTAAAAGGAGGGPVTFECSLSGAVTDAALPAVMDRLAARFPIRRDVDEHEIACLPVSGTPQRRGQSRVSADGAES